MSANLARNVAHHDIPLAVHNRTTARTERFMAEIGGERPITGRYSLPEFMAALHLQ
jgi:6-phosphogluconate dehydrogenase